MNDLVTRLCDGTHPVEISLRPAKTAQALKERIDQDGFVHVRFTATRGVTELGVRLDRDECQWQEADFERGVGTVRLSGCLTLDYVPVRCVVDIDLGTLEGVGALHKITKSPPPSPP